MHMFFIFLVKVSRFLLLALSHAYFRSGAMRFSRSPCSNPSVILFQVTYTDDLVNILRISYYAVQAVTLLVAYVYIRNKIMAANDRTPIYLPPVALPFGMGPAADNPRPKETSYFDHEMEQVRGRFGNGEGGRLEFDRRLSKSCF